MIIRTSLTALALVAGLTVRTHGADSNAADTLRAKQAAVRRDQALHASIRAQRTPARAAIVAVAATPIQVGTVTIAQPSDATQVPRYGKLELLVPITTSSTHPYDPDPATGLDLEATFTAPAGSAHATWTVPGFFDGSSWRVRFAPDQVGVWSYAVSAHDATGTAASASGQFTVVTSSSHGWIRIAGKQLAFSDGTPFVGFGHNTGWQATVDQPSMATMVSLGENVLSFWLATPWLTVSNARAPIENLGGGLGVYDQAACGFLDQEFANAEANGIRLLPSIWAHDALTSTTGGSWVDNVYSTIVDPSTNQPITPSGFFATSAAGVATSQWTYQQNYYRYLLARWGYSTALLGWVGAVEIDGTTAYQGAGAAAGDAWCASVQSYFAAHDPYRTVGATYPIAFSKTDQNSGAVGFDVGFAMRAVDSYKSQTDDIGIAYTIATETQTMHASGKPCFHTEFGGKLSTTGATATEPLHFHDGIWAGLNAGASITPLKWGDAGSWPLLTDPTNGAALQNHMSYLTHYAQRIRFLGDARLVDVSLSDGVTSTAGAGQRLSDRGFAWLLRANGTIGGGTVTATGLTAGAYAVRWYDTWSADVTGTAAADVAVAGDGNLALPIAAGTHGDLAVRFQRRPVCASQSVNVVAGTTRIITVVGDVGTGVLDLPTVTSLPAHGTLAQTTDGLTASTAIASAPTPITSTANQIAYTAGSTQGTDTFTLTVHDDLATSAAGTITVHIVGPNHRPSFTAGGDQTVLEDAPAQYVLPWATAMSDGDPGEGQQLDFLIANDHPELFSAGPTIDPTTGALNFTPALHAYGLATLTVRLHDDGGTAAGGQDTSLPQTVKITITKVNHAPVATDQTLDAYENVPLAFTPTASDVDHDPLTYAFSTPAHGVITGGAPPFTYTPITGFIGTDTVTVTANDGTVNGNAATITINVHSEQPPTATPQIVGLFQDTARGIVLAGDDPDHAPQPLSFTIATTPTHGTLSGTAPTVTYTPAAGYTGGDSFTFTVSDGAVTSDPAIVTIAVLSNGSATDNSGNNKRCGLGNGIAALQLLGLLLWWRQRFTIRRR